MKTKEQKIETIVAALNAYSPINAPEIVTSTINGMDAASVGVLHGITGVFLHAVNSKMPAKWLKQIHGDLLDAFCCLAEIAHDERRAA